MAVASILVGKPEWIGLLPGTKLLATNMFELNNDGRKVGNISGLLKSVSWLFQENVHIMNLSFAGAVHKVMRKVFVSFHNQKCFMVAAVWIWGGSDVPAFTAAYKGVTGVTRINDHGLAYATTNSGKFVIFATLGVRVFTAGFVGRGGPPGGASFPAPVPPAPLGFGIFQGRAKNPPPLTHPPKKTKKKQTHREPPTKTVVVIPSKNQTDDHL